MQNASDKENELGRALERAIKNMMRGAAVVDGVITEVDEATYTCSVQLGDDNGKATFFSVPLRVLISNRASVIEIPKVDSPCLICFRDSNTGRPQMVAVHSVLKLLVNCDNVIFNDGQLGGMVKAKELKDQSEKDKAILDALIQVLTGATINEPGNNAPSALQIALKAALSGKSPGTWDNLENPKITQ
jgi:hypothetical protein